MKVGIITYNISHAKTQELVHGLLKKNYEISLILINFKEYKKRIPLYDHRPTQFTGPTPEQLAKNFNLNFYSINQINNIKDINFFLIGGGGLIGKNQIIKDKIINCHPGLIPLSRGLDSLKWTIYNAYPLGNTLHYIDENIDSGKIISHKITPIFESDCFNDIAKRHYDSEINMLINFENYLAKPLIYSLKHGSPTKRMSTVNEGDMTKNLEIFKKINIEKKFNNYLIK